MLKFDICASRDPASAPVAFPWISNTFSLAVRGSRTLVLDPFPATFGTQLREDCIYRLRFIGVVVACNVRLSWIRSPSFRWARFHYHLGDVWNTRT